MRFETIVEKAHPSLTDLIDAAKGAGLEIGEAQVSRFGPCKHDIATYSYGYTVFGERWETEDERRARYEREKSKFENEMRRLRK